jgi:hypothetical protein
VSEETFGEFVAQADEAHIPVFDRVLETDFGRERGEPVDYRSMLTHGADSLVYCAFHPCRPGPGEVEFIEPAKHHVRTDEYDLFRTDEWKAWLDDAAFEVVGMRQLRDEMRARRSGDATT